MVLGAVFNANHLSQIDFSESKLAPMIAESWIMQTLAVNELISSGPTTLNLYCNFQYYIPVYVPLSVCNLKLIQNNCLPFNFSETTL